MKNLFESLVAPPPQRGLVNKLKAIKLFKKRLPVFGGLSESSFNPLRFFGKKNHKLEAFRLAYFAMSNANDMICIASTEPCDKAGGFPIVYVNEAYTTITGYAAEEVIGKAPSHLQGPGTDRQTLDRIRLALTQWKPVRETVLNYKKNGEPFWSEISIVPIADETGWFTHWVSVQRDVTAQKKAQEELELQAHKFQTLIEATQDGLHILRQDGSLYDVNSAFCDLLGYTRNEIMAMNLSQWDTHLSKDQIRETISGIVRSGSKYEFDSTNRKKDGNIIHVHIAAAPIIIDGITYLHCSSRNITNLKRDLMSYKQTAERLELALHTGAIGVWDWDLVNDRKYWDDRMYEIYGISREAFAANYYEAWERAVHPDDQAMVKAEIQAAFKGEREYRAKFRVVLPCGAVRHIEASATVMLDESGKPVQMIGVNKDITERVLAEQSISAAKLAAEAAVKAKTQFLSNMIHEIRTPMNGIIGLSTLAQQQPLTPVMEGYVDGISSSANSLMTLLNGLLDFYKLEAGKVVLDQNPL